MTLQTIRCPNCGHENPLDSFFCERCGSPVKAQLPIAPVSPQLALPMPPPLPPTPAPAIKPTVEVREIRFSLVGKAGRIDVVGAERIFGRTDLMRMISSEDARYISRQHFQIKYENGRFYIRDLGSKNGTKLNGNEISGKGWVELKSGDIINVAGVVDLQFLV